MDEISKPKVGAVAMMDEHDTQKGKYMTFKSGEEYYGLKIQYVNEIIGFQEITPVPETEDYIMGLINLRGKIIPVIDVHRRFNQEPFEYDDRTCNPVPAQPSSRLLQIADNLSNHTSRQGGVPGNIHRAALRIHRR